jgi:predicted DNA binding CopG/RHH family protein
VEVTDPAERQKAMVAAKSTKSERTNIRLSLEDVVGIKKKASEYGLGYQTLIASIVHQYVTGRLVEAGNIHR